MPALSSWNDGIAKQAILGYLARVTAANGSAYVPPEARVAVFDNDGTLWCEKPNYTQLDFFVSELRLAANVRPELAERPEYAALLAGDHAGIAALGIERIALALVEQCAGLQPEEFEQRARDFVMTNVHTDRQVPYAEMVYQPMLELLDILRAHAFEVFIVSGGGTEFVRAVSRQLYGVKPERVVGTLVAYEYVRRNGVPMLVRTSSLYGEANEGRAKVSHIQAHLGRRPIFGAGNSAGDREMLEYAAASGERGLAILVDHDDGEREYSYASEAGTFKAPEAITDTAQELGWTVVSMKNDWTKVFADK